MLSAKTLSELELFLETDEACVKHFLEERFRGQPNLNGILDDKYQALQLLVRDAKRHHFDPSRPVAVVASPGRERLFGGHTDFPGLGGPTVNCTSVLELFAIVQVLSGKDDPGMDFIVTNCSEKFPTGRIDLSEIQAIAGDIEAFGRVNWKQDVWFSYLQGALAWVCSADCKHSSLFNAAFSRIHSRDFQIRAHFGSIGKFGLPATGGMSSSCALTGCCVVGLCDVLDELRPLRLVPSEARLSVAPGSAAHAALCTIANSDHGEYFLGKKAGSADKTAVLFSIPNHFVCVGSFPEFVISRTPFASVDSLFVFMVESSIPRLSLAAGTRWLAERFEPKVQDSISAWARHTMATFSSQAFVQGVMLLRSGLRALDEKDGSSHLSSKDITLLSSVFGVDKAVKGGFLRELSRGGSLEKLLRAAGVPEDKIGAHRARLVLKALSLVPREVETPSSPIRTPLRATILYGIAEVDRVHRYCDLMSSLDRCTEGREMILESIIELVRLSHDGDRCFTDYRTLERTQWAFRCDQDPLYRLSDADLVNLTSSESSLERELWSIPGVFCRSLPEFDDFADAISARYGKRAAARVAAAGLGGSLCVHSSASVAADVLSWLVEKEWKPRRVCPGPSLSIL